MSAPPVLQPSILWRGGQGSQNDVPGDPGAFWRSPARSNSLVKLRCREMAVYRDGKKVEVLLLTPHLRLKPKKGKCQDPGRPGQGLVRQRRRQAGLSGIG